MQRWCARPAETQATREQLERAMAVLLGEPPAGFALPPVQAVP